MKTYEYKIGDEVTPRLSISLFMRGVFVFKDDCQFDKICPPLKNGSKEFGQKVYLYFQRYKPTNWTLVSNFHSFGLEISKRRYLTEQQRFKVKYVGVLERVDVDTYAPRLIIANKDTAFAVWGDGVKKIMK